jgi:predicted RNase H-like HicB family nuclease
VSDRLHHLIVIEHVEGIGYSSWAPDLPGCVTAASTREECDG